MITSDDWLSFGFVYIYVFYIEMQTQWFKLSIYMYIVCNMTHSSLFCRWDKKKKDTGQPKQSTKVRKNKCLNCLHYVFGQKTHLHCPENFHVKIECNNYQLSSTQWCTDYSFSLFTIRINSSISVQIFSIKWFMNFEFAYHHRKRQGVYLFRFCIEVEENLS